jgi:hypothetical protein
MASRDYQWDESSFFRDALKRRDKDETDALRKVYDHVSRLEGLEVRWGSGTVFPRFMVRQRGGALELMSGWGTGAISIAARGIRDSGMPASHEAVAHLGAAIGRPLLAEELEPEFETALVLKKEVAEALHVVIAALGNEAGGASEGTSSAKLGTEYRIADENINLAERDPFDVDPAKIERGTRRHAVLQNAVAHFLVEHGIEPRSASSNEPEFDLLWENSATCFIAEVKSVTDDNEEKQLRLGLGQVLRYRSVLGRSRGVIGVLVSEREPRDRTWLDTCRQVEILLVWPGVLERLLERGSEGVAMNAKPRP